MDSPDGPYPLSPLDAKSPNFPFSPHYPTTEPTSPTSSVDDRPRRVVSPVPTLTFESSVGADRQLEELTSSADSSWVGGASQDENAPPHVSLQAVARTDTDTSEGSDVWHASLAMTVALMMGPRPPTTFAEYQEVLSSSASLSHLADGVRATEIRPSSAPAARSVNEASLPRQRRLSVPSIAEKLAGTPSAWTPSQNTNGSVTPNATPIPWPAQRSVVAPPKSLTPESPACASTTSSSSFAQYRWRPESVTPSYTPSDFGAVPPAWRVFPPIVAQTRPALPPPLPPPRPPARVGSDGTTQAWLSAPQKPVPVGLDRPSPLVDTPMTANSSATSASVLGEIGSPLHALTRDYRSLAYILNSPSKSEEIQIVSPTRTITTTTTTTLPAAAPKVSATQVPTESPPPPLTPNPPRVPPAPNGSPRASPSPPCEQSPRRKPRVKPSPMYTSRGHTATRKTSLDTDEDANDANEFLRLTGIWDDQPAAAAVPAHVRTPVEESSPVLGCTLPLTNVNAAPAPTTSILLPTTLSHPAPGAAAEEEGETTTRSPRIAVVTSPDSIAQGDPLTPQAPLVRTHRFYHYETSRLAAAEADGLFDSHRAQVLADLDSVESYQHVYASLPNDVASHVPDPAVLPPGAPFSEVLLEHGGQGKARTTFFLDGTPVLRLTRLRDPAEDMDNTSEDGLSAESSKPPGLPKVTRRRRSSQGHSVTAEQLGWRPMSRRSSNETKESSSRAGRVSFAEQLMSPHALASQ